jgi:hypothetical protein
MARVNSERLICALPIGKYVPATPRSGSAANFPGGSAGSALAAVFVAKSAGAAPAFSAAASVAIAAGSVATATATASEDASVLVASFEFDFELQLESIATETMENAPTARSFRIFFVFIPCPFESSGESQATELPPMTNGVHLLVPEISQVPPKSGQFRHRNDRKGPETT